MSSGLSVLIVDDSSLSREALRHVVELERGLRVVGEASSGEEAVSLARRLKPALVTMDLNMPGMGGLKAIEVLMAERPTAVVVISERTSTKAFDVNYEALSRGALELVPKSAVFGPTADHAQQFAGRLLALAQEGARRRPSASQVPPTIAPSVEPLRILGIGASTGGPKAVAKLLSELPRPFPLPIALVQHMAEDFFDSYLRFLGDASGLPVRAAVNGQRLEQGTVTAAPPRQELMVRDDFLARLLPAPAGALISPSVDSLFYSLASHFGPRACGVLLTGMGDDGAQGLLRMRRLGSRTLVQDQATSAVFGMPKAAIEVGAAEVVLPLDSMPHALRSLLQTPAPRSKPVPLAVAPPGPTPRAYAKPQVVLVDEDPATASLTKSTLESEGYEVRVIDNPMVLVRTLRKAPADVVLLDPSLTAMSGEKVLEALRKHAQLDVPVFLLGLGDIEALRAKARLWGCEGALRKGALELVKEINGFIRLMRNRQLKS
jgi:two-component system, chemotaxis family, protein-glutamate methylesterase/glutaminase